MICLVVYLDQTKIYIIALFMRSVGIDLGFILVYNVKYDNPAKYK